MSFNYSGEVPRGCALLSIPILCFPDADWSFQCTFEAPRDHVFPLVTDEDVYSTSGKIGVKGKFGDKIMEIKSLLIN